MSSPGAPRDRSYSSDESSHAGSLAEPMWSARPARNCIACLPPVKAVGPRQPPQRRLTPPEAASATKKHHHRAPQHAAPPRGLAKNHELPPPVGAVVLPGQPARFS